MPWVVSEIKEVEKCRRHTIVAGGVATLDRLLSDEMIFVHGTGYAGTKLSYPDTLQKRNPFITYNIISQKILSLHGTAVSTGKVRVLARCDLPEKHMQVSIVFMTGWAVERENWQQVRYQPTFTSGADPELAA